MGWDVESLWHETDRQEILLVPYAISHTLL